MSSLFASGHVVDAILALVVVEATVLAVLSRSRRGPPISDMMWNLAAGFFLLLALRAALTDAAWPWIAAALCAAGIAHSVDQARRWRT